MKVKLNRRKIAARLYHKLGWSIIPVLQASKRPLVAWTRFQNELPLFGQIVRWIQKWPKLNWAIVLGKLSGVVALDIDSKRGGFESLAELERRYGPIRQTPKARTGGGGLHFYFKHPGGYVKSGEIALGVEIKGDKSLCTLPPSIHASGRRYEWEVSPKQCALAPMPDWLMELASATEAKRDTVQNEPLAQAIQEGSRNNTLFKIARFFKGIGLSDLPLSDMLADINARLCSPPLDLPEVRSIISSVEKYPSEYDSAALTSISAAETKWITAKELAESPDIVIDWIWHGFIGLGMVSLLSAKPKAGKSTLLFRLLEALSKGKPFLGFETKAFGKTLLLTEEPENLVRRRIRELGLAHDQIIITFKHQTESWEKTIAYVRHMVEKEGIKLVIVDTVSAFWRVETENEASDIKKALGPIENVIKKHNAALLLIHHLRKADGDEGTAIRGSGQLFAMVEVGMELTRIAREGTQRRLQGYGRYEESQREIAIELNEDGYHSLGKVEQFKFSEVKKRILEAIPAADQDPIADKEIREALDPKSSKTTIKDALVALAEEGKVKRFGKGVKGDPYRYTKRPPFSFKAAKSKKSKQSQGKKGRREL